MSKVRYITDKSVCSVAEPATLYEYPEVVPWQVGSDDFIVFNVWDKDRLETIKLMMDGLTPEQKNTLVRLAPDWHGTAEDLINAAKELA